MPSRGEEVTWRAVTCSVSQGAVTLLVLLLMLGPAPGWALCQDRCDRAVPRLAYLRMLWSRSYKRVGERRISFEEFMLSLVQASSNTGHRAQGLSNALMDLIQQYQDCMMACEHPFSKRGADRLTRIPHLSKRLFHTQPCSRRLWGKYTSSLLARLCMMTQGI